MMDMFSKGLPDGMTPQQAWLRAYEDGDDEKMNEIRARVDEIVNDLAEDMEYAHGDAMAAIMYEVHGQVCGQLQRAGWPMTGATFEPCSGRMIVRLSLS